MDLKKNFSEDTKKLIESVATQMTKEMIGVYSKATMAIANHFIQPIIDARQKHDEQVWGSQIVFIGEELPIIRINEEVKGKVEVRYQWQRISPELIRDFRRLRGFKPDESEQDYAHVVVFLRDKNEKTEAKPMYHNLNKILPKLHPSAEDLTVEVKQCQACGEMFILNSAHPDRSYCSKRCRERAQKRRYRDKLKKNEPPQKKK